MRLSFIFLVPAVLSLNLIACASDDSSNEPSHDAITTRLLKDGDHCLLSSDCESKSCVFDSNLDTKGVPAPCVGDNCGDDGDPAPVPPMPAPAPAPTPAPKGKPDPSPAPAPAPTPAPKGKPDPAPAPAPAPDPRWVCAPNAR